LLHGKFIQDNVYQILSESLAFVEDMTENILAFLSVHSVVLLNLCPLMQLVSVDDFLFDGSQWWE